MSTCMTLTVRNLTNGSAGNNADILVLTKHLRALVKGVSVMCGPLRYCPFASPCNHVRGRVGAFVCASAAHVLYFFMLPLALMSPSDESPEQECAASISMYRYVSCQFFTTEVLTGSVLGGAGKYTVPVFWDKKTSSIVNNECAPPAFHPRMLASFVCSSAAMYLISSILHKNSPSLHIYS